MSDNTPDARPVSEERLAELLECGDELCSDAASDAKETTRGGK